MVTSIILWTSSMTQFSFFPLFFTQMKLRLMDMVHGIPAESNLCFHVQMGSAVMPSTTASFNPGQTGKHLEIIVMILEGINSHLRLVLERNFPFITNPLHLLLHQMALRPNTELNTPQGKPDLVMVHPQILLDDGATQDGGFQITNRLPFPTKNDYLRTSATLIGTWMHQEQPPKSAKHWSLQLPAPWIRSLWVNPLLEKKNNSNLRRVEAPTKSLTVLKWKRCISFGRLWSRPHWNERQNVQIEMISMKHISAPLVHSSSCWWISDDICPRANIP